MTNLESMRLQKELDALLKAHDIDATDAAVLSSTFVRLVRQRRKFLGSAWTLS